MDCQRLTCWRATSICWSTIFHTLVDVNSAVVAGESVNYYIDETLVDANRLRDAAALHIGTHGMVQVVDVFTLPETDGVRRVVITDKVICEYPEQLILRPRTYTMGIGCRRDTPKELILDAITQSLQAHKLSPKSIVTAASVIVKQDEVGH